MITILSNVTFIGNEAFHKTSGITMIHVLQEDEKSYGKEAFRASEAGLHKRITVFQNYETNHPYQSSENNSYKNALSIVYTLHYADMKSEKKLWGQSVNVSCYDNGSWFIDPDYTLSDTGTDAPAGYQAGWVYNDKVLEKTTVLKPAADELRQDFSYATDEPVIQFLVDDKVIETTDTYPNINVSNNKPHIIGFNVSHLLETNEDAPIKVKFEYAWTDV